MALCRCKNHPPANNRTHIYTHWVYPIGYPDTSSICGRPECEEPGFIYLREDEYAKYLQGEDVFTFSTTNETMVRVEKPNHGAL